MEEISVCVQPVNIDAGEKTKIWARAWLGYFGQRWLKFPTIRRIRRSIADLEKGRWPLSPMRLTEKRDPRGQEGFVHQHRGLIFVACVFICFMQAGLLTGHTNHDSIDVYPDVVRPTPWLSGNAFKSPLGKSTQKATTEHPIPKLMQDAEDKFRALLSKQSRTLNAAVREYKKRYRRDPPKGFDDWWRFAHENKVKLVDEFDGLVEDLAPFWEISGEELRRRALQVSVQLYHRSFQFFK